MSFTRRMIRILTKRILTCLLKKSGVFRILFQNSKKVTKKVPLSRKGKRNASIVTKAHQPPPKTLKPCSTISNPLQPPQNIQQPPTTTSKTSITLTHNTILNKTPKTSQMTMCHVHEIQELNNTFTSP